MTFSGRYARFDLENETTQSFCDGLSENLSLFSNFDFGMIETGNLFSTATRLSGGSAGICVCLSVRFCGKWSDWCSGWSLLAPDSEQEIPVYFMVD